MRSFKTILYLLVLLAFLAMALLSGTQHDWVSQFDPGMNGQSFQSTMGNRVVLRGAAGLLALGCLTTLIFAAKSGLERALCIGLILLTLITLTFTI